MIERQLIDWYLLGSSTLEVFRMSLAMHSGSNNGLVSSIGEVVGVRGTA